MYTARHPNDVPASINSPPDCIEPPISHNRYPVTHRQHPTVIMGIKGLTQVIQENAPDAIRNVEIKHEFGRKIAIVSVGSKMLALFGALSNDPLPSQDALVNIRGHYWLTANYSRYS